MPALQFFVNDLEKIEEIYHAALEKTPAERAGFLAEVCGDDEDLRHEVESLLAFDEEAEDFIETPPNALAAEFIGGKTNGFVGREFNHYRVLSLLGTGGMGEVYLAEDAKLERRVALKILPTEFANDEARMSRFVREAKSASALNHPNIITIHEIGESGGVNYISTEFIEGETLSTKIKKQPLDVQTALEIAVQIASALDTAHKAGIIHRDIKPENIMIRPDGLVKILDFGIAKLGRRDEETERKTDGLNDLIAPSLLRSVAPSHLLTKTGVIIGTASYMSPEQAKGKKVDARSDIFSFGIVFYEMLTGRRAFQGKTALETVGSILKDEPAPLKEFLPDISAELENIVEKMLKKNADERFQTAGDLLTELKNLRLENNFQSAARNDSESVKTQLMNAPSTAITGAFKKHKFGTIAAAVLILVLLGVGLRYFVFSTLGGATVDSLAVLPFQNAADEFLGDGIAETLINNFTKIPELRVMARNSAFRYRGRDSETQIIGKELGVTSILTGRITQEADKISIQIDLVNAADGTQIFGNRYDGKPSELLDIQQKIVRDVAARLTKKEQQASKKYTDSAEAYEFYLRGRYLLNKRTADELKRAIQEFKQAIDRDPNFALAYVGLANGYALLEEYAGTPATETLPQAKRFAQRALELDDSLAEAYAALGFINSSLWEWTEAERDFKRAIELNPNLSTANHWYCAFLLQTGRIDDALREIKRAQELDPLSSIVNVNVGLAYLANSDNDSAVHELEKIIALDPNYWTARSWLGAAYSERGDHEKAFVELQKGVELSKRAGRALSFLGYALAKNGKRAEALEIVRELEEKYKRQEATVQNIAVVYAGLGDKDRAFEWLEKNFTEHSGELGRIRWYPQFKALRDDPRYKSLLQRMGQTP